MSEQPQPEGEIDWSLTTWKGQRLRQHQQFYALTFREKMEALERMSEASRLLQQKGAAADDASSTDRAESP